MGDSVDGTHNSAPQHSRVSIKRRRIESSDEESQPSTIAYAATLRNSKTIDSGRVRGRRSTSQPRDHDARNADYTSDAGSTRHPSFANGNLNSFANLDSSMVSGSLKRGKAHIGNTSPRSPVTPATQRAPDLNYPGTSGEKNISSNTAMRRDRNHSPIHTSSSSRVQRANPSQQIKLKIHRPQHPLKESTDTVQDAPGTSSSLDMSKL